MSERCSPIYKEVGYLSVDSDVEWMINDMKPWYDDYCFSEAALKKQSKVFNCDMVVCYLRHYVNDGEPQRQMIAPNTKTDYGKMENLLQLDQLDGDRKGTFGGQLILGIPNNNVRKQYYGYLLVQYQEEKYVNLAELKTKFTYMAFDGKWEELHHCP